MSAQIAQRFAAIDRRSNGSQCVSLVYNAASSPNPNPIPHLPQSLLPPHPSPSLDPLPLLPLSPADFTPYSRFLLLPRNRPPIRPAPNRRRIPRDGGRGHCGGGEGARPLPGRPPAGGAGALLRGAGGGEGPRACI
jgi:hypothetical protein